MDIGNYVLSGVLLLFGIVGYFERSERERNEKRIEKLEDEIAEIKESREDRNDFLNKQFTEILVQIARITK